MKNYIDLNVAKSAKNKGYSNGTKTVHIDYNKFSKTEFYTDFYTINNKKGSDLSNNTYTVYEAPKLGDLKTWFREEHRINVESNWLPNIQKFRSLYTKMDVKPKELTIDEIKVYNKAHTSKINFDSYEEALNYGLLKAFELI